MTKSIFEQLGGTYEQQGDYLLPCPTVPAKNEQPIGAHGKAHGADETGAGYNGTAKGRKRLRMGAENE